MAKGKAQQKAFVDRAKQAIIDSNAKGGRGGGSSRPMAPRNMPMQAPQQRSLLSDDNSAMSVSREEKRKQTPYRGTLFGSGGY